LSDCFHPRFNSNLLRGCPTFAALFAARVGFDEPSHDLAYCAGNV